MPRASAASFWVRSTPSVRPKRSSMICRSRAESAALRAESYAPEDGTLLSVNGTGGAVVLDAQDVGALPAPVAPQAGALLRVLSIRSDGSLVVDTVTPAALKPLLEAARCTRCWMSPAGRAA